jgi:hypothetical protein
MNLLKLFNNPKVAFITFAIWIIVFLLILKDEGIFSKRFLHFGPSTDPETQTEFLGSPIDTWPKVITLYLLGFFSVLFSTYYRDIFETWIINSVRDHKEKQIKMSKITAYLLTIIDPVLDNINSILEFFVLLTLQLQFFIPQVLGELFITILSTRAFLSKKKFNSK